MPTITIDGNSYEFEGKKTILQVALENDYEIPHYCYHPGLSIVASCRICLAEIFAPNPKEDGKIGPWPPGPATKLQPTCQSPALDGMIVHTQSPKSIANQKAVMEYLLINHPLDCPVCDQAGECHLQDYSYQYGRAESRFEEDKIKQATKDLGPHVKLYGDRCIMCSRCVRFTREVTGTNEIGVFGRGSKEEIDIYPGRALDNELSGNVVDICPVGALLDKDFLFSQRVWFLSSTPSIDGLTASGDNIYLEHNEGRLYRIKPRVNLDVNQWWISDEIRYGWKFIHDEQRLRLPKRQQLGTLTETDWHRALGSAARGLVGAKQEGGEGSLTAMISPMLPSEEAYAVARFIRQLDEQAVLALGPVPVQGEDKTFPGGYTVYAEKCPNARGVRRVLEHVAGAGNVLDYEAWLEQVGDKKTPIKAALLVGGYPSDWTGKELASAMRGKFSVVVDVLPNKVADKADVLLPGATWAEKAGVFENAKGRVQSFQPAIPLPEFARSEGQIALDLATACDLAEPQRFDAESVRAEIADVLGEIHHPEAGEQAEPDMEYVEL